eukprot:6178505-Pleurochrysis_carterae.AAC.2
MASHCEMQSTWKTWPQRSAEPVWPTAAFGAPGSALDAETGEALPWPLSADETRPPATSTLTPPWLEAFPAA